MSAVAWPDTQSLRLVPALVAGIFLAGCNSTPAGSGTPSPDGMGYCCPLGTPSCNATPLGGFSPTGGDCMMRRVIDAHPTMFRRATDEHGCEVWSTMNPGESCLIRPDAGADASSEPDAGSVDASVEADASVPDAGSPDAA